MIDIEPIDQLIMNKDLALEIFKDIPLNANRMRMNKGHAMFYISLMIDGEVKMWRYLRHRNDYVPLLAIYYPVEEFERMNGVFDVDQFRFNVYQLYASDVYTKEQLTDILNKAPCDAQAYDPINGDYWRTRVDGYLEYQGKTCGISHKWNKTSKRENDIAFFTININCLDILLKNK